MQIKLDLTLAQTLPDLPRHYEEEMDDVRSILGDLCQALADTASADFLVSGFGQDRWPVDVRTDLPVFLEQLPNAITSVETGASFSLDFYEQGVERTVHFHCQDQRYIARCESHADWNPNPAVEMIDRLELRQMLVDVREAVTRFLERRLPQVAIHPWIQAWAVAAQT